MLKKKAPKKRDLAPLMSSNLMTWATPPWLFDLLDEDFEFNWDLAASADNALCKKYWTEQDNALTKSWGKSRNFLNPPYGRGLKDWVYKAADTEYKQDNGTVLLIPARTDTAYFHDNSPKGSTRLLRGRLRFSEPSQENSTTAPFPSMIMVFGFNTTFYKTDNFVGDIRLWDFRGKAL